jgi:hypothetical protein
MCIGKVTGLQVDRARMDFVRGRQTELLIPAHRDALRAGGEAFLTQAFQVFGALSADNRVSRITRCEVCPGGSTGHKLFLSVEYEKQDPRLHTELFVKFSRDFDDPVRDNRGKYEMESEVRLAAISRLADFPINVPVAYFADYEQESKTGLLITQQVGFGDDGVEPHRPKCMDHVLPDPLAHYQTIIVALARIAAAHRSGRLSPEVERQFPFDPIKAAAEMPAIPYDEQQLRRKVAEYADFAARYPMLLPAPIRSAEFITRFGTEAMRFLAHEQTIRRFLHSDPDLIALCHWNAQIDNAWFWRDATGALQCGLMDWGHVGQMNLAFSLWGCLSGTLQSIWDHDFDNLLTLFIHELHRHGGPLLPASKLLLHLRLYIAMMGLSYFLASPSRILQACPDIAAARGPHDPMFRANETARNNLHLLSVLLNVWRTHEFGVVLESLLA